MDGNGVRHLAGTVFPSSLDFCLSIVSHWPSKVPKLEVLSYENIFWAYIPLHSPCMVGNYLQVRFQKRSLNLGYVYIYICIYIYIYIYLYIYIDMYELFSLDSWVLSICLMFVLICFDDVGHLLYSLGWIVEIFFS